MSVKRGYFAEIVEAFGLEFFSECVRDAQKIVKNMRPEDLKSLISEPDPDLIMACAIGRLRKEIDEARRVK